MTSGIYKILNTSNNHCYVGSALNIESRWSQHKHRLNKGNHHSIHLQNSWNKYGAGVFEFSIIEICFPFVLIFREQYWMNELKPEYNILPTAGSRLGAKVSDKTRAKLSAITKAQMTPENREKISKKLKGRISTFLGRHHSDEARAKLSASTNSWLADPENRAKMSASRKGRIITPEWRAKLSEAGKGRVISPETRAKLSKAAMGNKRTEGYKPTDEVKAKMSARMKGNKIWLGRKHTPEQIAKMSAAHLGRKHTAESRAKMSMSQTLRQSKERIDRDK